jgi:hypothetical protein
MNSGCSSRWAFRYCLAAALLIAPMAGRSAVFTTKLHDDTVAAWDRYVQRFERGTPETRPLLEARDNALTLVDLNPNGNDQGASVPSGYIHHWIGAIRIPGTTVASVESTLINYAHWTEIYAPDVKLASGILAEKDGVRTSDLRMVTEESEGLLRFAFDMRFHVTFHSAGGFELVDSRSYQIRESNSAKPPYTDLLPPGSDHGILWRLNSYWRLKQMDSSVYAECQVISLSRKPLFGIHDLVKARARESLTSTLRHTAGSMSAAR